jgi:hypothetical protein
MAILTPEQKRAYLEENGANLCPFCQSPNISGGHIEISGREAWQEVGCVACGETWQDVYTLSSVETQDELDAAHAK